MYIVHCTVYTTPNIKNILNLGIKTVPITVGADAIGICLVSEPNTYVNTKAGHILLHPLQPWQAQFYFTVVIPIIVGTVCHTEPSSRPLVLLKSCCLRSSFSYNGTILVISTLESDSAAQGLTKQSHVHLFQYRRRFFPPKLFESEFR